MKSVSMFAIVMLTLLYSALGYSQSVDSTQTQLDKKMVKVTTNEKGEVVFVFHDGREAQLFYGPNASTIGQVKLQQVENTCGYNLKPASCVVEGYYTNMRFQLEWTKHFDPQKIGKVVERINTNGSGDAEKVAANEFLTDITYQKILNNKPKDYPKYKLKCDHSDWIKNVNESQSQALFSSVAAEIMIENGETQVNENQTSAEIYNAQFDLVSDQTYQLSKYQYSSSLLLTVDPFLSNQVIHFVYIKNKKSCHVAFAANAEDVIQRVGEMQEMNNEIQNKKLLRQAGNMSDTEIYFQLEQLLMVDRENASTRFQ